MHQGIESASLRIQPETARSPNRQRAPSPWLDLRGDVTEESELESAIRRANCLVWHADVDERVEGQLQWKMTLKASPLLRKIFGSDSPAKGNILWTRDDVPRWDAISRRSRTAILGGKPGYNQQFQVYVRERAFYLDEHVSITRAFPRKWSLVGVAVDITARRMAELALIRQTDLVSTVLSNVSEAVIALDREGSVVFINKAAADLTQWDAESAVGHPVKDICTLTDCASGALIPISPTRGTSNLDTHGRPMIALLHDRAERQSRVELKLVRPGRGGHARVGAMLIMRATAYW